MAADLSRVHRDFSVFSGLQESLESRACHIARPVTQVAQISRVQRPEASPADNISRTLSNTVSTLIDFMHRLFVQGENL